jgi:hypothetical protein
MSREIVPRYRRQHISPQSQVLRHEATIGAVARFNVASVTRFRGRSSPDEHSVSKRIEDYEMIGDRHSVTMVARDGAIELCSLVLQRGGD